MSLYPYAYHLFAAISAVGGVYPVGKHSRAVGGVLDNLGKFELVGSATQTRALFRLFTFWLTHFFTSLN